MISPSLLSAVPFVLCVACRSLLVYPVISACLLRHYLSLIMLSLAAARLTMASAPGHTMRDGLGFARRNPALLSLAPRRFQSFLGHQVSPAAALKLGLKLKPRMRHARQGTSGATHYLCS